MVYDANGDSVSVSVTIDEPTGLMELNLDQYISVYPNPNRGLFTLDLRQVANLKSVSVFNVLGERVLIVPDNVPGEEKIDLRHEPNGIYYIQVISETGIALKKVILE